MRRPNKGLGLDSKMDDVRTFEGQRFGGKLLSGSTVVRTGMNAKLPSDEFCEI